MNIRHILPQRGQNRQRAECTSPRLGKGDMLKPQIVPANHAKGRE